MQWRNSEKKEGNARNEKGMKIGRKTVERGKQGDWAT